MLKDSKAILPLNVPFNQAQSDSLAAMELGDYKNNLKQNDGVVFDFSPMVRAVPDLDKRLAEQLWSCANEAAHFNATLPKDQPDRACVAMYYSAGPCPASAFIPAQLFKICIVPVRAGRALRN